MSLQASNKIGNSNRTVLPGRKQSHRLSALLLWKKPDKLFHGNRMLSYNYVGRFWKEKLVV
ncbi:hypothetical protein SAMN05428962_3628 [Paenibacillus sp. BC26]|nr:hypothetical protein SAMN05428962_3628 [Paenibacillus sp. BC26]